MNFTIGKVYLKAAVASVEFSSFPCRVTPSPPLPPTNPV
jgi:hypothetical protein